VLSVASYVASYIATSFETRSSGAIFLKRKQNAGRLSPSGAAACFGDHPHRGLELGSLFLTDPNADLTYPFTRVLYRGIGFTYSRIKFMSPDFQSPRSTPTTKMFEA
jgi:hypothetical protein